MPTHFTASTQRSCLGSGLSMLSDGVDRSFAFEGLQALGEAECSTNLKHLNLHGCTLLSTLSMTVISKFTNLETLDLSGCNKLTLRGAKRIGKTCTRITTLSLALCRDCINNAVVEALVTNLNLLSTVNLQFCHKVSERSLKALATCTQLQSLDLTGCVGVTDQAILHLSEGNYSPGLRHLLLAQCSKVGDTSLSYLDGCVSSLETLSLKGTKVTAAAVQGVRDSFPYSLLKSNSSFHGYYPLARINDRKIINRHHKRACAAAVIQAYVRTRRERDTLTRAREERGRKRVAILIGALYRGRRDRRHFRELRRRKKELLISTLRLQCTFMCRIARKRLNRQREMQWLAVAPLASKVIQRRWRGVLARRLFQRKKEEKRKHHQRQIQAIIRLQSWSRMLKAKQRKRLLQCQKLTHELNRFRAIIKIQCAWRRYTSVQSLKMLKAEFLLQQELEKSSALRIAGAYRIILFRKVIKLRINSSVTRGDLTQH